MPARFIHFTDNLIIENNLQIGVIICILLRTFLPPKCQVFRNAEKQLCFLCMCFCVSTGSAGLLTVVQFHPLIRDPCDTSFEVKSQNCLITTSETYSFGYYINLKLQSHNYNGFCCTLIKVRSTYSHSFCYNKAERVRVSVFNVG